MTLFWMNILWYPASGGRSTHCISLIDHILQAFRDWASNLWRAPVLRKLGQTCWQNFSSEIISNPLFQHFVDLLWIQVTIGSLSPKLCRKAAISHSIIFFSFLENSQSCTVYSIFANQNSSCAPNTPSSFGGNLVVSLVYLCGVNFVKTWEGPSKSRVVFWPKMSQSLGRNKSAPSKPQVASVLKLP